MKLALLTCERFNNWFYLTCICIPHVYLHFSYGIELAHGQNNYTPSLQSVVNKVLQRILNIWQMVNFFLYIILDYY